MPTEDKSMCLEVLVKREGRPYMRVAVTDSPATIGREGDAAIRLESKKVSRNHARIEFDQGRVRIVDSGSRNGFRVDGTLCEQADLSPANTVILAGFEFRARLTATPRSTPGKPIYFGESRSEVDTAPQAHGVAESRSRTQPPTSARPYDFADELSEGWAEIAREGREDTNIIRQPTDRPARVAPEQGFLERSVMNQLATARSFADVRSAVGDDSLDAEDADEYIRPDVEPLLATLHRETEALKPKPGDRNVAVEVIFAIGASIEDTALLAPGERYWWGGQPTTMEEAFIVPSANRFPIVTHLASGVFRVDVPQVPGWKLFRKGTPRGGAHRTGVLMGIEVGREEQVEVAYGPFTFYARCVVVPERPNSERKLERPSRSAIGALVASSLFHLAAMLIPVEPLPTLSDTPPASDRFVEYIAPDLTLEFPEAKPIPEPERPKPILEPELEPLEAEPLPEMPPPPEITEAKPSDDVTDSVMPRSTRRKAPRNRPDMKQVNAAPARQVTSESDTVTGTDTAETKASGQLSVADFKVVGHIGHLPSVKIDPAKGPKVRSGAPVLRGDKGTELGLLDKSGQGMQLTPPGRLSRADVRRVVNRNSRDIGRCQAKAIRDRRDLEGKLVLQWEVMPDGSSNNVRVVYDDMGSPVFTACAKAAVLTWVFPEPKNGAATVSYPFKVKNFNL